MKGAIVTILYPVFFHFEHHKWKLILLCDISTIPGYRSRLCNEIQLR